MSIHATQHIRPMRGGAQSHLMLASDESLYVSTAILANEMLATRLAQAVGLTLPACGVIEVSPWLIKTTPELSIKFAHASYPCRSGLQFGSRFAGGLMPKRVLDYLPEPMLVRTTNLREFAGMLVVDKWTCNTDGRQAVFVSQSYKRNYSAFFIDQGYCFGANLWKFEDAPLRGVFPRMAVYAHVNGWDSFEPWLERVEKMSPEAIWKIARSVPTEWYGGDIFRMEQLVATLIQRRQTVRELIENVRDSDRAPFPLWQQSETSFAS
jgi:hypothetical protein